MTKPTSISLWQLANQVAYIQSAAGKLSQQLARSFSDPSQTTLTGGFEPHLTVGAMKQSYVASGEVMVAATELYTMLGKLMEPECPDDSKGG